MHDVGQDGVAVALAEMAIGGECGVRARFGSGAGLLDPFAPTAGGYLVQVAVDGSEMLRRMCTGCDVPCCAVGESLAGGTFELTHAGTVESTSIDELSRAWTCGLCL